MLDWANLLRNDIKVQAMKEKTDELDLSELKNSVLERKPSRK